MNSFGESASQAASRYFGGGATFRNLGLTGGRAESVGTTESFTEEQHTMTKAELEYQPNDEEDAFNDDVIKSIRKRLVFGEESTSWGLKWECGTVDQPEYLLGGWLSQVSNKSFLSSSISNGLTRFCVLDENAKQFQQCMDATLKVRRFINYEDMHTVRPRFTDGVWYLQVFGKRTKWELMPIKSTDRELLLRWTCALQYRSGSYDASLSRDVTRAHRAAVWTQSKYRVWKAKQRVQRKRERKNALLNRMALYVTGYGWDLYDSDDDEDVDFGGEPAVGYVESVLEVASNLWGTVGSWLGLGGQTIVEEDEQLQEEQELKVAKNRMSTCVQMSGDLPPLKPGQVMDEMWENQRWNPALGWGSKTLGKTERCAFTDRLGRGNFKSPAEGWIPLEPGWKSVTNGFELDLSGINRARCDNEGFTCGMDWPLLDADHAKGLYSIHHGTKDFVRRRRWYRIREPIDGSSKLVDSIEPVLLCGWLGMKTSNGRWHSRQFALVRPGLRIGVTNQQLRHPALIQFRFGFRDFEGVTKNGGTDGNQWRMLTEKSVSILELIPTNCVVDESAATAKFVGQFHLVMEGVSRTFCANDANERHEWCVAITEACREAIKTKRPRTMRLVGGAFETASYATVLMDSLLLVPVDAVDEAFFDSPSTLAAIHIRSGNTQLVAGNWDLIQKRRTVSYVSNTLGRVEEVWQRARTEPGQGFVLDRRIECPDAQFGDEYAIKLRFVLVKAEMQGQYGTRILVSMDVDFMKPTMMVGYITSEAKKNQTLLLRDVYLPCVVAYLQGQGLVGTGNKDLLESERKITWGSSSVSNKPGKKLLVPQESEKIVLGNL